MAAASRSRARNRLPSCDQPRFKDLSWRKMFGPNSPPDRFGIRCPLSTEGCQAGTADAQFAALGRGLMLSCSGHDSSESY